VWRYVSPYTAAGVLGPEQPVPSLGIPLPLLDSLYANYTFQAIHYPPGYAPQFPAVVTGRRTFYAGSEYETGLGSRASAIATDKVAYIPNGTNSAAIANVTSYVHGITGIMVELTGTHGTLTAADFTVKMSEQYVDVFNTPPSAWVPAPAFTLSTVNNTPGSGTTRYELVWANGVAPKNRYVEVIVKGNDALGGNNTNTGLAASDYFFFGNLVGESFNTFLADGYFAVEASDEVATRFNQGLATDLSFITNRYDFNRDLVVDSSDQIIARFNQNFLVAFSTTNPPAAPVGGDGSGAAVASALAGRSPVLANSESPRVVHVPGKDGKLLASRGETAAVPAEREPRVLTAGRRLAVAEELFDDDFLDQLFPPLRE
jgi:hypothetical protein